MRHFSFTPFHTYDGGSYTAFDAGLTWMRSHVYADGHVSPKHVTFRLCVLGVGFALTWWPGGKR